MGLLNNKVALITGGAGEIGIETARRFLEEGAKVAIVDLNQEKIDKEVDKLKKLGEIIGIKADVTSEEDTENYVNKTVEHFGRIDIFFNNAGIIGAVKPIEELTAEEFNTVLTVNVTGVFLGQKYVQPIMRKQKSGSIIITSSDAGWAGDPSIPSYVTSKHAVVGLMKSAALSMAKDNVRVNTVHPTSVDSSMMRELEAGVDSENAEAVQAEYAEVIPMGRYATLTEIANAAVYLGSDLSEFVTGTQQRVDGGQSASSN